GVDRGFDVFARGEVQPPVALDADAVDADAGGLQHLHHAHDAVALLRAPGVEVVVVQLRVGRGRGGEAEGVAHQGVAVAAVGTGPERVAVLAVLAHHLVDHVPGLHLAAVAAGDHPDVLAHAFAHGGRVGLAAVAVLEEPGRGLVVPDQGVSDQVHV